MKLVSQIILFVSLFFISLFGKGELLFSRIKICDKENTVGVDQPYFGWEYKIQSTNIKQVEYQLLVSSDSLMLVNNEADMWNSNRITSSSQNYIYYDGKDLKSATKYYWKINTWLDNGEIANSSVNTFITGLLTNDDWEGAKWIKRPSNTNEDYTYFRKLFSLQKKKVKQALVFVSAVHDYELYFNGKKIGTGPGYHYPQHQYYKSYDVTKEIVSGVENVFACLTHWYNGGQGRPSSAPGFILKSIIEFDDGTIQTIGTDKSWIQIQVMAFQTGQPSRNTEGVGYIDKIDARKIIDGWNQLNFAAINWNSAAEIGTQPVAPWTGNLQPNLVEIIEEELTPVSLSDMGNGTYVIDLGKVYSGIPKISFVGGASGETVKITGGFTLKNGYINNSTNQHTDMRYDFMLNGADCVFQPMVYLGMRYIQVKGSPNELTTENVKFISRYAELDSSKCYFESSNEMLDNVWDLMTHSIVVGAQESFVDTPTREKGGFLGDSWMVGTSAMATMGERLMNQRVLKEFLTSQEQYWPDGRMNAVYPNVDGKRDIPDYTQMFLFWAWDYFQQTGNVQFLKDYYLQMKMIVNYVYSHRDDQTGLIHNLTGGSGAYKYGIIDWPATMRYGYDTNTEARTVINLYAYYDFVIFAKIAALVDETVDHNFFEYRADEIKKSINSHLINKDGLYIDGLKSDLSQSTHVSQHANMLPLAMGIVPEESYSKVVELVKSKKMNVGMVTLKWLTESIGIADEGEHLIDLYTNTEWAGWAKCIEAGATTTWESWDALEIGESLSHPWGAVGVLGIQNYILGVQALLPQFEKIQVKPLWFGDKLNSAKGIVPTDRGNIIISWTRSEKEYKLNIEIPVNMTACVSIPSGDFPNNKIIVNGESKIYTIENGYLDLGELGSGQYEIVRKLDNQTHSQLIRNSYKIYPNPVDDILHIDLGQWFENIDVKLFDACGKLNRTYQFKDTQTCELVLSNIEYTGIYFMSIDNQIQKPFAAKLFKN